jgi:predicted nucleic acid-binding protein
VPKTIQIRDLDDDVYDALARRSAEVGLSVPEFMRKEAERLAARPSVGEWLDRTRRRRSRFGRGWAGDADHAAPHIVDIEVFSLIRRDNLAGLFDHTFAGLAVDDLRAWPGERYGHRALLERAWELRHSVRGWDAAYVALAEVLDATLLTLIDDWPRHRVGVVALRYLRSPQATP